MGNCWIESCDYRTAKCAVISRKEPLGFLAGEPPPQPNDFIVRLPGLPPRDRGAPRLRLVHFSLRARLLHLPDQGLQRLEPHSRLTTRRAASPMLRTRKHRVLPRHTSSGVAGSCPASTSTRHSPRTGAVPRGSDAERGCGVAAAQLGADCLRGALAETIRAARPVTFERRGTVACGARFGVREAARIHFGLQ
jgi:hypothetical protein